MNRCCLAAGLAVIVLGGGGCATTTQAPAGLWNPARAEVLTWRPDDPNFTQDRALEASGLALTDDALVATAEKYARLLFFDAELEARVVEVGVPRYAELEGVAWHEGALYLCDEAHAAVYRVDLGAATVGVPKLAAVELPLEGLEVAGGKIGVEGIEVSRGGGFVHLLLERSGEPATGCVSRLWSLRIEPDRLVAQGSPVDLPLEDCNWRLTGLAWMGERLVGLKTQYPGERYQVVEVDPATGATTLLQDFTGLLRSVRADGWGNNVEGIAVAADGALWLIGDNAVTGVIDDPYPPLTDEKALLLRIPRVE